MAEPSYARSPRAWADIDLTAIAHNRNVLGALVGPDVRVMAVVKADAYGHGIEAVSGTIGRSHPDGWFGVATVPEACAVRRAAPAARIVVLAPTLPEEADEVAACRATPVLSDPSGVTALARAAEAEDIPLRVHIEVDTGMGRSGVAPDGLASLVREIGKHRPLTIEALMTHFPDAEGRPEQAEHQILILRRQCEHLRTRYGLRVMLHAANSAATIGLPESRLDMVRPGMALYGLKPALPAHVPRPDLRSALHLYTRVALVREMPKGHPVSYGGT